MPPLVKLVPEFGTRTEDLRFFVEGPLTYKTVSKDGGLLIRFGEFSQSTLIVFWVVLAVAVGCISVMHRAGISLIVALFPLAGILIGYWLFILRQKRLKGIELEVHPNRCVFRSAGSSQPIEGIRAVILVKSYRFGDGTPATEGVSEVFLEVEGFGFAPVASEGNYGGLDDFAETISKLLQVQLKSHTR